MNYKITLAYDGTNYHGWQLQEELPTIQLALSRALSTMTGAPVVVHGAGRTDAGVHAEGQIVSFHLPKEWTTRALRNALNGNLPRDIRVLAAEQVDDEFHARFSAKEKTYRYQIYNAPVMHPLLWRFAWHFPYSLNVEKLVCEGQHLLGTHDFTAFTVTDCETHTNVRELVSFSVEQQASLLQLYFKGKGFLRYQVRTMVTALLELNRGRLAMTMPELIASQRRELIRGTAPAQGLTLLAIEY